MPALRELQTDFAAAIFSGVIDENALLARCAGNPGQAAQGIAAYRRSVLANLAGAVRATYPVVENIVGSDFLAAISRRYAQATPSTSGDLNAYGGQFADFLAADPACAALPYLPDIARLEWLVQHVYGAADAPAQDLSQLAATSPDNWGELRFSLDPAHALLASPWPVVRIWEINQAGYAGAFTVDFAQSEYALIHRQPQGIAVTTVDPGQYALLLALASGRPLADAVEAALSATAAFDLAATLQGFIASALLRGTIARNGEHDD